MLPQWTERIVGKEIPLLFLDDLAYLLMPWLMKSYQNNGHLTSEQKQFNYRLSKARVVVEHTYSCRKGQWQCLLKQLDVDESVVPKLV